MVLSDERTKRKNGIWFNNREKRVNNIGWISNANMENTKLVGGCALAESKILQSGILAAAQITTSQLEQQDSNTRNAAFPAGPFQVAHWQ